ncbi:VOC family protein [Pelagibius litoralis]|uniref:VOC family protein n=1 Tax=Pelagibius litoralis TaxID=374515 RepID=A0A967F251_9PROT|nr:VOC family protein [Pelagibius litoralis]NIA71597.1 VOC family protein [Pelagibius litoralis]
MTAASQSADSGLSGPLTRGAHHIGLTVPDLPQTLRFFTETLGFQQVGEKPDYPAAFVSDGTTMITLWQAHDPATAVAFDRKNVIGLHHVALAVENAAALEALQARLEKADGVVMEFAAEPLGEAPLRHMMCAIPGGIRVEFIAPAA